MVIELGDHNLCPKSVPAVHPQPIKEKSYKEAEIGVYLMGSHWEEEARECPTPQFLFGILK